MMDRGRAGLTSTSSLAASGEPSQARILRRASVHPRGHVRRHQHRQHHHRHHHHYRDDNSLSHSPPVGTSQLEAPQCFRFAVLLENTLRRLNHSPFAKRLFARDCWRRHPMGFEPHRHLRRPRQRLFSAQAFPERGTSRSPTARAPSSPLSPRRSMKRHRSAADAPSAAQLPPWCYIFATPTYIVTIRDFLSAPRMHPDCLECTQTELRNAVGLMQFLICSTELAGRDDA